MTENAKQDTTKTPAEPAETGAAATESAATKPATGKDEAAETAAQAATATPAGDGEPDAPDLDETKRKFREALERKNQSHAEGQGQGGRDAGKINNAHGPAASRRNFRRKSG
jgi:Family of unknown function (DUF5302)